MIILTIKAHQAPEILRACGRCGCKRRFYSSEKFRVNAQQKKLDVWLIYKCKSCGATFNLDIASRVSPKALDPALYSGFLANDAALALRFASDPVILAKNRVQALFDEVEYAVIGETLTKSMLCRSPVTVEIRSDTALRVRLDKILCEKTELSRSAVKRLFDRGCVTCEEAGISRVVAGGRRVGDGCTLTVDLAAAGRTASAGE